MGLSASCGSSDPFKDYGSDIREATVEETTPPVPPGINSNSIILTPSKRIFLFEEGVESAYELNARVFIPNAEFDLELINPPEGMTIELKSEFNTDVLVSSGPAGTTDADEEDPDADAEDTAPVPPSMTNQKIFVVKWKPGYDSIPDDSVNSIQRYVSVRFKVDEDIATIWEIPYEVLQSERQLKVVGADVPNEFLEGEKTKFNVYVEYPNFRGPKFPALAVLTKANSSGVTTDGCSNMQNWIKTTASSVVVDPTSPHNGMLEYTLEANFTKLDITTSRTTCTIEVMVQDARSVSAPYEVAIRVKNIISAPTTTWNSGFVLEFEQGNQSAFFFQIFGLKDEGTVELSFVSPCIAVLSGQGNCNCRQETGVANRHILNCVITANHKVFDSPVDYTLEMKAKVKNLSEESEQVTFTRKIRFYPPGTKNTSSGVGVDEDEAAATVNPSPAIDTKNYGGGI